MTTPQQGFAIGIDLGTSNTVAVVRSPDGRTRPLLFDGQPILPSTVFVDESGRIHVGRDAQRMAQLDPARCEPNPKRRIDEQAVLLGDRELPVVTLLAALLKEIATKAVEAVGFLPPAALTHPAAWGPTRRGVLLEAVKQAGWPPVKLVPEPIAAARYFAEVMRRPVPVSSALAVFDFGGGTLDVAVVRNDGNGFSVIGAGGDERLGGLDLDEALVQHVGTLIGTQYPQIWQHLSQPTSTADRRYRRLFWEDVRGAKEMLSRSTNAPVPVPGVDQAVHLTREELERLTTPLLERAVAATQATVGQAGLRPDQLSGLFLVGGSSRVPLVARLLHAKLGVAPTVLEQPELPVAEGALAELMPVSPPTESMPYPMSAMPASPGPGMPVSAMPGQAGPVSGMPGQTSGGPVSPGGPVLGGPPPGPYPPAGPPPGAPGDYPQSPAGVPGGHGQGPIPVPPPREPSWYQRKKIMVPAAAAVVLLLVLGGYFLLRSPYQEREFSAITKVGSVKAASDSSGYAWAQVIDDTAYTVAINDSKATVQAIPLSGKVGKPKWTKTFDSGDADWDSDWGMRSYAGGGVAIRSTSSGDTSGRYYLIDPSGKSWHVKAGDDDYFDVSVAAGVVVQQATDGSRTTAYDLGTGHVKWRTKGVAYLESTPDDLDRAAGFDSGTPLHGAEQSTRAVLIDSNSTASLIDLETGKKLVDTRPKVTEATDEYGDTTGFHTVYNGMLLDGTDDAGFTMQGFSLDDMSQAWTYNAPAGYHPGFVTPCGKSLVCVQEYKEDDLDQEKPETDRLVVLNLDDGKEAMDPRNVPTLAGAIGVGDRIVVTSHHGDGKTTVYDDDGDVQDTLPGQDAARLDNATMLLADGVVTGDETDPSWTMSGYGVQSGKTSTLGKLDVDLTTCELSDSYLACADGYDSRFEFYRFRE